MASKVDSSVLSVISEDRTSARKYHDANDDCESVYNAKSRSAYGGSHKKKLHPLLLGPSRRDHGKYVSMHAASKSNLSEFTQRIMSAKLLRVKQVQNQLTETQIQLNELINENRILRNLQKRQEGALRKYEGNHAELPQLIRSHNEEIRTLKANNKIIKAQLRESNAKLKERENELENLKENYSKLKKLSSEKNLLEREKLQKKVEELQELIKEQDEKIQVLSRKVLLESKNYRHHLNLEISKHKDTQKELNNALAMINKLESQLAVKDKLHAFPGAITKPPLKRDNKMPSIASKALEVQSNVPEFSDDGESKRKQSSSDSPETDSELFNSLISTDTTPSPTPDIFPDINPSKKTNQEIKTTTEISPSKLEMFQLNCDIPGKHCSGLQATRRPSLSRRSSKTLCDAETNAKILTEKLTEDLECIDNLVQEKGSMVMNPVNAVRLNSLYEEVKSSASKLESELTNQIKKDDIDEVDQELEEMTKIKITEVRRNVPKRKLEDEKSLSRSPEKSDFGENDDNELTEPQQLKLISMTKTWNDIKGKIREERIKAERKMKELCKMKSDRDEDQKTACEEEYDDVEEEITSGSESENGNPNIQPERIEITLKPEAEPKKNIKDVEHLRKDLRFANFTSDEFILTELEKTDKMFKKLKNENRKPLSKSSSLDKAKTPIALTKSNSLDLKEFENINYRTESHREANFLENFQSEHQKQNLLKALKAIDVGRDPNRSSDESDHSDGENKKSFVGLKHIQRISSSTARSKNDLMAELFGTNQGSLDKNDNIKLEYGAIGTADD